MNTMANKVVTKAHHITVWKCSKTHGYFPALQTNLNNRPHPLFPIHKSKRAQIQGERSTRPLNCVQCHLLSVGHQYETSFLSPLWCKEFWHSSYSFGKFMHPWTKDQSFEFSYIRCMNWISHSYIKGHIKRAHVY